MRGVPVQHTDWMRRCYAGRHSRITFDDYTSTPVVDGGLDQGDPHSGIAYLIYNSPLAEITRPTEGEHGLIYVDDDTVLAVAHNFATTHKMISSMIQRPKGVDEWADTCNSKFGPAKYQLLDASQQ
ncbi:hypothetical protein B0H10DRAFT_1679930, partial [Mycena sp. CBHHK59/15]